MRLPPVPACPRALSSKRCPFLGLLLMGCLIPADALARVHHTTGLKIGEVTPTSAIVWTRLASQADPNPVGGPQVQIRYLNNKVNQAARTGTVEAVDFPEGVTIDDLAGAVPGGVGQVRVLHRVRGTANWTETAWRPVDPEKDFTRQFSVEGLAPGTDYEVRVEGRDAEGVTACEGGFATAPDPGEPSRVVFTVSTGQKYSDQDRSDGFKIYPAMQEFRPDFFVHTGDIVYYDRLAKTLGLARLHWHRMYSLPTNVDFHRQVATYFEKDDHDTLVNDCWPGMSSPYMHEFTFAQGQAVFLEQVPMRDSTYRTYRWGKDLQVWFVEGRDFRSPNTDPDGPEKTIWGEQQKAWFKRTLQASDATFRVLVSPTPLVGPDRSKKNDNHANAGFAQEGRELREFLAAQKDTMVVCGDRHWQYASVDPETQLREYSCGPASNKHAGGWSDRDYVEEYHRFLRVKGGFLSVTVDRPNGVPTLTARFHGVDGEVHFEDSITAN